MDLVLMCCKPYYYNYYSCSADMTSTVRWQIDLGPFKVTLVKGHLANRQIKIHMQRHERSNFQQTVV